MEYATGLVPCFLPPVVLALAVFLLVSIPSPLTARGQQPVSSKATARFAGGGNAAEIPMELAGNAVFVPVKIGRGRPSNWLLDTASPRIAADPSGNPQAAQAGEANDSATLALPGVEILEPNLIVHSFKPLWPWYGIRVSGVIGNGLLTSLAAELDYDRLSIELYDGASYRQPDHMQKLSIRWAGRLPTVRAKLRLGGRTVEGDFVLNTGGSSGIVVYRSFLSAQRMLPLQGKTIPGEAIDASGERAVTLMRGEAIEFGRIRISRPIVAIAGQNESSSPAANDGHKENSVAGWIGGGILRKFRLVLDFPKDCIFIAPNRDFIFPIEADASGATITAAGTDLDQFEVRSVREGSPAAQAGLKPGDRIVLLDGEKDSDFSLDQVRDLLRQTDHSAVLVVERLGRRVRIDLNLQPTL